MSQQSKMIAMAELPIESLIPFSQNPFGTYTGQRLEDLAESIQANGVLVPIIVRPAGEAGEAGEGAYEIISGHNRVEACKIVSLETVPAMIREDLSDQEALLIAIETNLLQRSFAELKHSEKAATLAQYHDAMKTQGRQGDLIQEAELLVAEGADELVAPPSRKAKADGSADDSYGLSVKTMARYLCVNTLAEPHKDRLDRGAIALRAAVSLSYLSEEVQAQVDEVVATARCRLSLADAEALRHEERPLQRDDVLQIVTEVRSPRKKTTLALPSALLEKHFPPDCQAEEIEAIIAQALELYFERNSS